MSKPLRIGVVGYGLVGRRHANIIRRAPDLVLAGVVEPDPQAQAEAEKAGAEVYPNISALVSSSPDGVVLATPTPLHVAQSLECIAACVPVLIEKPIAVSALDAVAIIDAADSAAVPLLVGHHRRHNGMVQAAKAALEAGDIGDIRAVQTTCWFYKPDGYFEIAPWRTQKGAGPISVNLVHDVDLLRHFCGEVNSVQAIAVPSRRGFENEDLATAILTFDTGAVATISVSDSIVAPWSWELTSRENPAYPATNQSCYLIGGSLGGMSLPDLRVWRHEAAPDWWSPISASTLTAASRDPLETQMMHFAAIIRGDESPLVSGLEGLRSLEVVEAVATSSRTGQAIEISRKEFGSIQTSGAECV